MLHFAPVTSIKMKEAISDPYCQAVSVAVSLCLSTGLCCIDNVRATLQSLQHREPRHLLACLSVCLSVY